NYLSLAEVQVIGTDFQVINTDLYK
ncbi:hypothetical protein BSPWISOX_2627, partial [uncultured Gammaproteobacteria bacterium]